MTVQSMNRVMLPFSAEEPCLFSTISELRECIHRALEGTKHTRPVVIYGVPSAGKSYLKHVLEERSIGVLDTDDLVSFAMKREVRSLIKTIVNDYVLAPERAYNALVSSVLIADPTTALSELAWGELDVPLTVRELRQSWRRAVDDALMNKATYNGVDVLVTNLRNLEYYDFAFTRTPAQAERYLSLYPGMKLELLQQWFEDSQATASSARVWCPLKGGEHILTC